MKSDIIVDSETIEAFSKKVEESSNELNILLDDMILLSDDLDKYFNTPTGKLMKETLVDYLLKSKKSCDSLKNFGVVLSKTSKLYDATNNQIAREVGAGD